MGSKGRAMTMISGCTHAENASGAHHGATLVTARI